MQPYNRLLTRAARKNQIRAATSGDRRERWARERIVKSMRERGAVASVQALADARGSENARCATSTGSANEGYTVEAVKNRMGATLQVTGLLRAWSKGDSGALRQLAPLVYDELRRMARYYMSGERPGNTLQPTALVNEAYLRLIDTTGVEWQDRAHFFAISAQMMRRILVDAARARATSKRGGQFRKIAFEDDRIAGTEADGQLLALDEALEALAKHDARKERVVELRHFAGLSVEETAEVLHVSPQTVLRDWKLSKSWLMRWMEHAGDEA